MKKRFLIVIAVLVVITASLTLSGCIEKLSFQEIYDNLVLSTKNSMDETVYYYKENIHMGENNKDVLSKSVNVYSFLDNHGEFTYTEDGKLNDLKVHINTGYFDAKLNYTRSTNFFCGASISKDDKKVKENVLFRQDYYKQDKKDVNVYQKQMSVSAYDLIESDAFKDKYSIQFVLRELAEIQKDDIIFDEKKGLSSRNKNVTDFKFSLTDAYYERVEALIGTPLLLRGDSVKVETAYGKISNITVYKTFDSGFLATEDELYDIKIVYYGPKLNMPNFDETMKDDNKKDIIKWQPSQNISLDFSIK